MIASVNRFLNNISPYNPKGRYSVNMVVSDGGLNYQNVTGGNGIPSEEIDWKKLISSTSNEVQENSKTWNTGDPKTFNMSELEYPSLIPFLVFQSGTKLKKGVEWTFSAGIVTIDSDVELYDGDDITFTGNIPTI